MTTTPTEIDEPTGFRDLTRAIARLSRLLDDADAELSAAEGRARTWRIEAQAAQAERDAANDYVATLRDELATAQADVARLTDRLGVVRQHRSALHDQVVDLGGDPVWKPNEGTATS